MEAKIETALDKMKKVWDAGDHRAALRMVAAWPRLGESATPIRQAWAATVNPDFYLQLKKDPDTLIAAGYAAMVTRYKLTPKKEII